MISPKNLQNLMKNLYILILLVSPWFAHAQNNKIKASVTQGCAPLSVSFSYPVQGISKYQWDFGNGSSSALANPTILFDAVGNYTVKLTFTTVEGASKTITIDAPIQVIDKPQVDFSVSGSKFCNGDRVTFNNTSTLADRYLWDFGDGNTSQENNPTHQYARGGSYQVTLVGFNQYGCQGLKISDTPIEIRQVTSLDFEADFTSKCLDDATIVFNAPPGYSSLRWDFGDGSQGVGSTVLHTYDQPGSYSVSLAVEDAEGCTALLTKPSYIQVFEPVVPAVEFMETPVCTGQDITFINQTQDTQSITWTFDDGFTSNQDTVTRAFPSAGTYSFTVSLTGTSGCTSVKNYPGSITVVQAPAPVIDISDTEGCVPFNVTFSNTTPGNPGYFWEIDGKSFTDPIVSYTFDQPGRYTITAKTLHSAGCENSIVYDSAIVVHAPQIEIETSESSGCMPLSTSFSLTNDDVTQILWDFGNGLTSTGLTPSLTYEQAGEYEVSATVVNAYGCLQTIKFPRPISVKDTIIDYTPPGAIKTCKAVSVYFNGGMGTDFWEWDFGDGNTSEAMNPTHVYNEPGTYRVSLTTNNRNHCRTTIPNYNQIIVKDVKASFKATISDTTECPGFTAEFENLSQDAERFLWDFGNGQQSTEANPRHKFEGTFQFPVVLTVWNDIGCSKRTSEIITSPWTSCSYDSLDEMEGEVIDNTNRNYTYQLNLCDLPAEVKFRNPLPQAGSWMWDFGDSSTSTEQNPIHIYTTSGTFPVRLFAFYEDGSIDTLQNYSTVRISTPDVNFTYDKSATCNGTEVSFRNSSPSLLRWEWDLGNGTTSTAKDPVALYTQPGVYQVDLSARDTSGCDLKVVKNVIIGNPYLMYQYGDNLCFGDSLFIDHNIEGYQTFSWDFGDGNTSTEKYPEHQYAGPGEYQVKLNATDRNGCVKVFDLPEQVTVSQPLADFSVDGKAFGCNTLTTQFKNRSLNASKWQWDFGDGHTSREESPGHTFETGQYIISLTVEKDGCSSTYTSPDAIVVDNLEAKFEVDQAGVCLPQVTRFTDRSENAVSWLWDFGDGNQSTDQNPVHTYTDPPSAGVTLKVTNSTGCTASYTSSEVSFFQPKFEVENATGCLPFEAHFKNLTERSVRWQWDFGDGGTSTAENPSHLYTSTGTFTVRLKVQSSTGCYDSLVKEELIVVKDVNASFRSNAGQNSCAPLLVSFENTSEGASQFRWDFGDNSSSGNANPFHIYTATGKFDVTLIAQNDIGCTDTLTFDDLVTANGPDTQFSASDSVLCHPSEIYFKDASASAIKWQWFFGDGNTSELQNPQHQYSHPGRYTVSLLATDDKGCEQVVKYDSIIVYPSPKARFELLDYDHCLPVTLEVNNTSENLQESEYLWDLGNGRVSKEFQPMIRYNEPGSYKLSLTTTNGSVCRDTYTFDHEIVVYDTTYQAQPEVQQLSVVNDKEISLKHSPYTRNNFKYGLVYRQGTGAEFTVMDTIRSPNDEFLIDQGVFPAKKSYAYKLQSFLYCHEPADLQALTLYKSIMLSSAARENDILLEWTPYEGHTFDHYSILRKPAGGQFQEIAQVPVHQTQFEDTEDLCPFDYTYQVKAMRLNGSEYYSAGNTTISKPAKNIFLEQHVQVERSTVENNASVYTEWRAPAIGPDKVIYYSVHRSTDDAGFEPIAEVPAGITNFLDHKVNVHKHQYQYKVEVVNSCQVKTRESNLGSTLYLQKETDQYLNTLFWTPYTGWTQGVSRYLLQRMNEFGAWETVEVLDGNSIENMVDLSLEEN